MADNPTIVLIPHSRSHPFTQRECSCAEPLKVGRSVDKKRIFSNNLIFDCRVLSRNHALIWYENGKFYIQDTKSSNGTFVNETRLSPSGEESAPVELKSRDIVQFGVNVNVEKRVTHGCIIATVMLYINEVEVPCPDPDVHQIMQIVQSSLSREQELETKLALMQEALNAARSLTSESMISIVKEDELISRLEMLENQLHVYSQNSQEDDLKKQLSTALEDKLKSETSAKESLRSILQEKLECVSKISQLQRDYDKAELECQQYKTLYDVVKQENTHELAKLREQLKNAEKEKKTLEDKLSEEKAALTASAETLKADVDFTKQQLNSVRARLEQTQDELFKYKVIVETEKQRKALQAAAENAPSSEAPAQNGHTQEDGSERKDNDTPLDGQDSSTTSQERIEPKPSETHDGLPEVVSGNHTAEVAESIQTNESLMQQPEQSLTFGTLVNFASVANNSELLSKLAASEGLVEQLRSTLCQYENEIQTLKAQLVEERSREHKLQLALSVVGGQLNSCFDQIQMQSAEILRIRAYERPSPDETGDWSESRQLPALEDIHLSELTALKIKFVEKEEKERHLEDQLMKFQEEIVHLQEDSQRLKQQLASVQEDYRTQLRVSHSETESFKKLLYEAQEEAKLSQKKLVSAQNNHPFGRGGMDDQHARLINTVALVAVGVALAAMVLTMFS